MVIGGGGEIRTLGGLSPSLVFKTSAFNGSATPPRNSHSTLPEYFGNADRSSGANCPTLTAILTARHQKPLICRILRVS